MPTPLVSGALCTLDILPLNASNQVCSGFTPTASEFVLTDDTAETFTIQSLTWDGTTGVGTMTFIAPFTAVQETRNLMMTLDGRAILINPSPLAITIMPAFGGKSVLTNAWLAWDLSIPNSTTSVMADYSGNNNYAVQEAGGNFPVPLWSASQTMWVSATRSTTIGRLAFSVAYTTTANGLLSPSLNPASLGAFTTGWPFRSVSTLFMANCVTTDPNSPFTIWDYQFTDNLGIAREARLYYVMTSYGLGYSRIRLDTKYNGTTYTTVIDAAAATYYGTAFQAALLTLVWNADGSGTLYANATVIANIANIWGPGVPIPALVGTSTLTRFAGLGDGGATFGFSGTYGQLELVAYTTPLTAAQVNTNAYAWGLV